MTLSTPSPRMHASSLAKECESLVFHSFPLVHLDRPVVIPRSRRHSMSHNVGSKRDRRSIYNDTAPCHPARSARRATETDLETALLCQESEFRQRTIPIEKNKTAIYGDEKIPAITNAREVILYYNKIHQANIPVVSHQASIWRDSVGITKMGTQNYIVDSVQKDSCTTHCTAAEERSKTYNSATKRVNRSISGPSTSSLVSWPPPPPPRLTSHKPDCKTRNISTIFETSQKIELPFSTATISSSSRPSHPKRTYSILEQDKYNQRQQHNCNATKSPTTASSPPRLPQKQRSDNDYLDNFHHRGNEETHRGFRKDYILGESSRSPSHMIIESCPQAAAKNVDQLKNYDFAFVKRTDGSWTYSILASRSIIGGSELKKLPEECMLFVMSDGGSTKLIKRRQWVDFIRLVAVQEDLADGIDNTTKKDIATEFRRQLKLESSCVPDIISIDLDRDDSSSVSFVSF